MHAQRTDPVTTHLPGAPSASAAAAQAAKAGGTSRRSAGVAWRGSAAPSRRPNRYGRQERSRPDQRSEVGEPAVPDAIDLAKLVHGAVTPVLGSVVDDVLREHRADTGQGFELLDGGRA